MKSWKSALVSADTPLREALARINSAGTMIAPVGEGSHIVTGASVRQGIRLGPNEVVAVGAAVVSSHTRNATLAGAPARLCT